MFWGGGTSLGVHWLELHASTVEGLALNPGWGIRIPHAAWHSQKVKTKIFFKSHMQRRLLNSKYSLFNEYFGGASEC